MTYIPSFTRLPISVKELIREYRTTDATSYSLAVKYGMEQRHISRMISQNLDQATRKQLECEKKSLAARRKWAERKRAAQFKDYAATR